MPYFSNQEDKTKNFQGKYFTKEKKNTKSNRMPYVSMNRSSFVS